jgi:hypothetical protein
MHGLPRKPALASFFWRVRAHDWLKMSRRSRNGAYWSACEHELGLLSVVIGLIGTRVWLKKGCGVSQWGSLEPVPS